MSNILGPYYAPWHRKASYFHWIRDLRPMWVRIHQPSAGDIADVQGASPETLIMLRSWDIDDHNGDRKREVAADPVGAARYHALLWEDKLRALLEEADRDGREVDPSKWYIGLINEPNKDILPQIVRYTKEWLHIARKHQWRLGVGVSSVGNFPKPGEHPNSWDLFKSLENAINNTGSVLIAHEYWLPEGPDFVWVDKHGRERHEAGNTAWRHHSIPLDVRIVIGEAGANGYLWNRHTSSDNGGWQNYRNFGLDAASYAAQVRQYIEGCDKRVEGVLLYMLDHHTDQWQSFDIEPALSELLAIRDARPQVESPFADDPDLPQQPPWTIHMPTIVHDTPKTMFVKAPAGLNVRKGPGTEHPILHKLPYGEKLKITGSFSDWRQVNALQQWVHGEWLSDTEPEPLPTEIEPEPQPVEPTGDKWERSYAFTAGWEGGFQNVRNDKGNWTGGQVGVGELKGTNWGISAASYPHLDIKNLTKEQAKDIFHRDYWIASGAHELDWPGCLIVFDTAILHGVGTAQSWLNEAGPNPLFFAARRLRSYTQSDNWHFWGNAWTRRVADLLEEAAK